MKSSGVRSFGDHAGWEVIFDYSTPQNFINGVTTLFSFTDYGSDFSALAFFVENQDGSHAIRAYLSPSHGGSRKCTTGERFEDISAGEEGAIEIPFSNPFTYVRGQVNNSSGFTVVGRWALLGKRR